MWIGLVLLLFTQRRFPLSSLCLHLLALHSLILAVGGHFAQGFIPAVFVRELLLRNTPLRPGVCLAFLVVCACLAFSAGCEFFEWWTALLTGEAAGIRAFVAAIFADLSQEAHLAGAIAPGMAGLEFGE